MLWAYRTTARSTTRETLFLLAYGYEAMVPVELRAGSLRRDNFNLEQNMILQWSELNFLEERRRDSQLLVMAYQWRTTRYFNSKVMMRRFQVGDLVLRRVLYNEGALDLNWKGSYKIAKVLTPSAYQLAHLNGDQILRSWNANYLRMYYQWLYTHFSMLTPGAYQLALFVFPLDFGRINKNF